MGQCLCARPTILIFSRTKLKAAAREPSRSLHPPPGWGLALGGGVLVFFGTGFMCVGVRVWPTAQGGALVGVGVNRRLGVDCC